MKKLILLLSVLFVVSCSKELALYTLTTSANPSDGGTVSPTTKQYNEGETATINATPAAEYVFQSWSGASGTTTTASVVMNSDKSVTANFIKKKYTLTTSVEGEGTITEKVIKAGAATDYNSGTIVELTATPSAEWLFLEWSGDLTGTDNPKQITIDKAKTVKAVFVKKQYALTVEIEGEGTVAEKVIKAGAATDYNSGTIVELTAAPSDGWELKEWTGDLTGTDNPIQITIDKAKTVKAIFSRIEYTLSIDFNGNGFAKIYLEKESQTDSISVVEKIDLKYFSGNKLKIKAVADEGWSFKSFSNGWENPVDLVINSNLSTTISFEYTQPVVDSDGNSYNVVTIPSYDENGNYIKDVIWTEQNFKGLKSKDNSMKIYNLDATYTNPSYYGGHFDGSKGKFIEFDSIYSRTQGWYLTETKLYKNYQQDKSAIVKTKVNYVNETGFMVHYRSDFSDLVIPEGWRVATYEDYKGLINYTIKLKKEIVGCSFCIQMWNVYGWGYQNNRENRTGFKGLKEGYISGRTLLSNGPSNTPYENHSYFPYKWRNNNAKFWAKSGPTNPGKSYQYTTGTESEGVWEEISNEDGLYYFDLGGHMQGANAGNSLRLYPLINMSELDEKDAFSIRLVKID